MANLSEDIQCAGSDTRPPMLDKTDFASWQQRIRLYCQGKENGVNILKSIDEGPFLMGNFRETLAEGTEGALHLEGSKLTKEDCESQLYDDFKHFCQHKEETIHDYYVWFAKLINDMRNIKMTMSRMQLNSKFVNNMLLEWGRFITAVKLNRGLRDSNYDQLYAYLKQYEAYANENKMMLERFTLPNVDPLALMTNVSHQQYNSQSSYVPPYFADNTQLVLGLSPSDNLIENLTNTLALLTQSYKTVDRIEDRGTMHGVQVQLVMGEHRTELGMLIQVKQSRLSATTATGLALNVDNMFQADDGDAFDSDVDEAPTAHTMFMANLSFVDPFYDEAGPSYDSDILTEYVKDNAVPVVQSNVFSGPNDAYMMIFNDMHEPHAQSVSDTTRNTVVDNHLLLNLQHIMNKLNCMKDGPDNLKKELHSIKMQLASTINHNKSMVEEVKSLKKDFKQKENKYLEEFLDMKALKEK
ncbi:hypothetical protein Tco_0273196, partial [Tanacetum coccineum]